MPARALRQVIGIAVAGEVRSAVARHARDWAPRYRAALEAYAARVSDRDIGLVRKVIDDGDADAVGKTAERATRSALAEGRGLASRHVPADLAARAEEMVGGSATDRAADWARSRSATLVTGVTDGTREAIRKVVTAGVEGRLSEASVKKALREVVPLDARRATALVNYRSTLEKQGMEPARIDLLAERQARRLVAQRAEAIARTEGARAVAEGRLDLWRELVEAGEVKGQVVRQWLTMRDEAVDGQCEMLDGELASLDGEYSGAAAPPAHANCRCVEMIRVVKE